MLDRAEKARRTIEEQDSVAMANPALEALVYTHLDPTQLSQGRGRAALPAHADDNDDDDAD